MPVGRQSRTRPAWCSETTPVMASSTTTTSSTRPAHWLANMPIAAEPQPTRIRVSGTPSTTGGRPAATVRLAPPSIASSTGSREQSASRVSRVALPSALEPPVRWSTPPSDSICEPYSAVVTWPMASPFGADGGGLGAEVAVGVDLHLGAAVGEDRLGDDGDDVGALDLAGDDEGGGLVVGVGGAGADAGREAGRGVPSQSSVAKGTVGRPAASVRSSTVSGSVRTMRPPSFM